jgi:hypothetical protein
MNGKFTLFWIERALDQGSRIRMRRGLTKLQAAMPSASQFGFFGKRDGRVIAPKHAMLDAPVVMPPNLRRK